MMSFVIGLGISLLIFCTTIYLLPHFSNKKSLYILLLLTIFSFVLSSLMGMLYSPIIGIGIFFLLVSSFALLIGKNQSWFEVLFEDNSIISRRRRYKEIPETEGSKLENLSTIDDYLLFKKNIETNENLQTIEEIKVPAKIEGKPQQEKSITVLEVAVTSVSNEEEAQSHMNQSIEIQGEVILYNMDDNKKAQEKVDEELSDQWMQKRMSALFIETSQEKPGKQDKYEDSENENNVRYDDISESYFNRKRSEDDGT